MYGSIKKDYNMKNALVRGGNIDEVIRKHGAIPTVKK